MKSFIEEELVIAKEKFADDKIDLETAIAVREERQMPVHPATPEPLKTALENMEATVQSAKMSLAFAAPEMFDTHWGNLQMRLAEIISTAIDSAAGENLDQSDRETL